MICLFGLHVDAGEGFVQQDHLPVLRQRAGQEDALLLAARQLADLAVAKVGHADAGQRLGRPRRGRRRAGRRRKPMWP